VRRLRLAIEAAAEATGLQPDFALPNAVLARRLGIDFGPVYLGRVVGWIAHAAEQYQTQDLKRPRAMYVGPLPRP
jgi:citrate synthase